VRSAFYAFLPDKLASEQASRQASIKVSVSGRRMAGQLLENSAEAGSICKTQIFADFGYASGTDAEKILGLRDPLTVYILLIGHAHHFPEYSRKMGRGHTGETGSGVSTDICPVVIINETNGHLYLVILTMGDGGRQQYWLALCLGSRKDVLYAGLLEEIAVAAAYGPATHFLVSC